MKILFDQGVPLPLRGSLRDHVVETAYENGWQMLSNGDLLSQAEQAGYEIFLTTDQNLKYQQTLVNRKIAVIVLLTTSWPKIRLQTEKVREAVLRAKENSFEEILF